MKARKIISVFSLLLLFPLTFCMRGQEDKQTGGNKANPCLTPEESYYFGVEITGILCGYCVSQECTGIREGKKVHYESNEIIIKLSILGEGMDVKISSLFEQDPFTGKVLFNETRVNTGNASIHSITRIEGDTAWYTGNTSKEKKKVVLSPGVILETSLRSPHLFKDFVQHGLREKKYTVYEPIRGEITEKSYQKKGEEVIILKGSPVETFIIEETDLSTGTKATLWLNIKDGMTVKTLVAGRDIYLTDPSVTGRIAKVNYDNVIFARVNKIIPDFSKVNYMKVRARIESAGEVITPESLSFQGQKFTGTVKDNLVDGIFEMEPERYDGTDAPGFPHDFSRDPALKKYLDPEIAVESNDPLLIKEAKRITEGAENSWEAAKRLSRWVANNIEGAIPGGGSAINTYKMRQGECGGHSRLLTAFCRAVGIPSRLSIGCLYTTHYGGSFGQHAWTEIYMGKAGWIAVDATAFETDYIDAGHIRLGERSTFQPKEMEILEYR